MPTGANPSSRGWICTRHFQSHSTATEIREETDFMPAGIDYVVFQLESAPTTGGLHWQMYIHCERTMKRTQIVRLFPCLGACVPQPASGTPEQNKTYCSKLDTRVEGPWEFGVMPHRGKTQTTEAVIEWMNEHEGCTVDEVEQEFQVFAFHNYNKIQELCFRRKRVKVDFSTWVFRAWQKAVVELLRQEPDDRTIIWVTDIVGKAGKSKLATFLCETMGAIELGGDKKDMAFMYRNKQAPIAIFDLFQLATFLATLFQLAPFFIPIGNLLGNLELDERPLIVASTRTIVKSHLAVAHAWPESKPWITAAERAGVIDK
eukprot:gene21992-29050_t